MDLVSLKMYWYVFNDQQSGVKEWSALSKQSNERHSLQGNPYKCYNGRLPRSILTVHCANNQPRTPILIAAMPASTGM